MFSIKRQVTNPNLAKYLDASQKAMREISAEKFQSKTLKQFFSDPRFRSQDADTVIVKSKETGEPVKVFVRKTLNSYGNVHNYYYDFFKTKEKTERKDTLAEKFFPVTINKLYAKFHPGNMKTRTDEFIGLGIRADELQIKDAISLGSRRVARESVPTAILYHLKMGFLPTSDLHRIRDEASLNKIFNKILEELPEFDIRFFTPIVIEKDGLWGKKYFIDINKTRAIAFVRKSREELGDPPLVKRVPYQQGELIDMELSGNELEMWKDAIYGKGCFDTTV